MKRMLVLCLCAVLILLTFSACGGGDEAEQGFFIGTVKSIETNSVVFQVDEDFVEKYGETVKFKKDGVGEQVEVGDEVRVDMKSKKKVEDFTVLLQKKHSKGEATDRSDAFVIPKWTDTGVPSETLDIKADQGEIWEYDCFGKNKVYRVVYQDTEKTHLARVYQYKATRVIIGNMSGKCSLGDFVKLEATKHRDMGSFDVVNVEDLVKTEVVDSSVAFKDGRSSATWEKPVIYLYPEKTETVSVKLDLDGNLTCTYPDYVDGWDGFTVHPDGTIQKYGREYYCLYWEGESSFEPDFSKGFCVKGQDTARFLEKTLCEIGLNDREANEFIIYWLPILQGNKYNLISFQGQNYVDAAKLTVSPPPDSVLRVFMSFKPLEKAVEIEPQTFKPFTRKGFTVVEWGGGQAK